MLQVTWKAAKGGFFDRPKVKKSVDRTAIKVLSRFGAFVRQTAKNSIRTREGSSPVGKPPHGHVGTFKRLIFFAYDFGRKSVVIGPTLVSTTSVVPSLLEFGGKITFRDSLGTVLTYTYRPRPTMGPAFKKELSKLDSLWANSVKR